VSKLIAAAAIRGAHKIIARAEDKFKMAREKFGENQDLEFPNTGYYLPIIYGMLGYQVKKIKDVPYVLEVCKRLLPPVPREKHALPYLAPTLDAGMATLFAEEVMEAIRYVETPKFYVTSEEPSEDNIWLGAADDIILRKRGVEFVDGTAPGFAAIVGSVPNDDLAKNIAMELLEKNLYVFMASEFQGKRFAEQIKKAGLQLGWPTRLVSFGPDISAAVFALGFATRAAMSFGGIEPGDFRKILIYNKDRVFAFVLAFGYVTEEWYANAAGAINWGFPTIADTPIPEVLPTGICTYEHVVSNIPHKDIVQRAVEVRGLKVTVSKVPIPVSYGPAFEGERVRGEDIYVECGGGKSQAVELLRMSDMTAVEDGKVEVKGPELKDLPVGSKLPIAITVQVAGRKMQEDFEPILERQIHHLLNYAQGIMHIGQRDIAWIRIAKQAVDKGFALEHIGKILHAKLHQDFGSILDKVQVTIYSEDAPVRKIVEDAKKIYWKRDERLEGLKDEEVDTFYSCTLCQSFAPNHCCIVTPERPGLCGAYNWLDCKASNEINPTGPNQPVIKGEVLDQVYGQWKGVNEFVAKASRGAIQSYDAYGVLKTPMTSCGCFECIAALLPVCQGFMAVDREFKGMTPVGMKFSTLAGMVGGGNVTPGFVGHSKFYITSRKYLSAEGGIKRMIWMPKQLKEEIMQRLKKTATELGVPDLPEKIGDETVATTEEELMKYLQKVNHPVLSMPPLL